MYALVDGDFYVSCERVFRLLHNNKRCTLAKNAANRVDCWTLADRLSSVQRVRMRSESANFFGGSTGHHRFTMTAIKLVNGQALLPL